MIAMHGNVIVLSKPTAQSPMQPHYIRHRHSSLLFDQHIISARSFSSTGNDETPTKSPTEESNQPVLLYEGPFASLTLKLKRISLTSAVIGLVGLPALSLYFGSGTVPATGQIAVIATAGLTAVGSTALLGYCFSPYVHRLERLPGMASDSNSNGENNNDDATKHESLLRITTRDIIARRVEVTFDPTTDVTSAPSNNSRPFCNFMVKGLPMYVHPEMIHDDKLRVQLVGEEPKQEDDDAEAAKRKKLDDDEFL